MAWGFWRFNLRLAEVKHTQQTQMIKLGKRGHNRAACA
jgi:hypothetical protein